MSCSSLPAASPTSPLSPSPPSLPKPAPPIGTNDSTAPETAAAVTKTALLLPPSATSTRTTALPGTLYTPLSRPFARALLPLYFYVHGGAFLFGSLAASDAECARIARALGVVVVHVDYRHTDDAPYPAQHDDAMDALRWAVQQAESWGADADRVVVSGESAGASLAVGVAVRAAKEVRAAFFFLVLSLLFSSCSLSSSHVLVLAIWWCGGLGAEEGGNCGGRL